MYRERDREEERILATAGVQGVMISISVTPAVTTPIATTITIWRCVLVALVPVVHGVHRLIYIYIERERERERESENRSPHMNMTRVYVFEQMCIYIYI